RRLSAARPRLVFVFMFPSLSDSTSQILACSLVSGIVSLACTHKRSPGDGGVRRGFGVPLGGNCDCGGQSHPVLHKPIGRITKIVISDDLDKDCLCPARTKRRLTRSWSWS